MRRRSVSRSLLLLLVGLAGLLPGGAFAQGDERLLNYQSTININSNASLLITETITVRSAGVRIRHGIYRDFPTRYQDQQGHMHTVGFRVRRVLRDGAVESYHLAELSNGVRLYLGRADVTLPPGEYRYTLSYTTDRQLGFFPQHDELYWNVTGNGWAFPIDKASATVSLPKVVPPTAVQVTGYTGPFGSDAHNLTAVVDASGRSQFATTTPLQPGEGLTIVVSFPKGIVSPPERSVFLFGGSEAWHYALLGTLLILVYYLVVWAFVGRDAPGGTIIPRPAPPAGLSPAAVRFLWRMEYDSKVFAAAVIDLAVHGVITIWQNGHDFKLKKRADLFLDTRQQLLAELRDGVPITLASLAGRFATTEDDVRAMVENLQASGKPLQMRHSVVRLDVMQPNAKPDQAMKLPVEEVRLATDLLGPAESIDLNGQYAHIIKPALDRLRKYFLAKYEHRYVCSNARYRYPSLVLALIFAGVIAVAELQPVLGSEWTRALAPSTLFILPILYPLGVVVWGLGPVVMRSILGTRGLTHYLIVSGYVAITIAVVGWIVGWNKLLAHPPLALLAYAAVAVAMHTLFHHLLKASTRYGRRVLDQIAGFRMYLVTAEGPRLNAMNPPEKTPALFEQFLPYALALDAEHAWAARFADVLAVAGVSGLPEDAYRPDWYAGGSWSGFHVSNLVTSLGDSFTNVISASTVPPGTSSGTGEGDTGGISGIGGGGFSGGGGGGGGGGGW